MEKLRKTYVHLAGKKCKDNIKVGFKKYDG
jgi:hypothetical protein